MKFQPLPDVVYPHDYVALVRDIEAGKIHGPSVFHSLIKSDLFFIVYFVLQVPIANHPFVVQACQDYEKSPRDSALFLWAREHFKSTIITFADTIKTLANDPEQTIAIFSYSREIAKAFLRQIKTTCEQNEFLKVHLPDLLWENPGKDAPTWSSEALTFKRETSQKEASIEAWGLIDGMPTSKHFSRRVYDDVETDTTVNTPELIEKLKSSFALSENLGTNDGTHIVIGTHYSHEGLLNYLRNVKDPDTGENLYFSSIKPATDDGTPSGKPVFLTKKKFKRLQASSHFYCQQLLDPTPRGTQTLNPEHLIDIQPSDVPNRLYKFLLVDPAGDGVAKRADRSDSWAIVCVGVQPNFDDLGISRVYILDMVIEDLKRVDALREICDMYCRNGRILKLGVEKTSITTNEIHVSNALKAKGKHVSVEMGNMELLKPAGRKKHVRIADAISWPLQNSCLFLSTSIAEAYRSRFKKEMEQFPNSRHDDGLDAVAYVWDLLTPHMFSSLPAPEVEEKEDVWMKYFRKRNDENRGWQAA